MSEQLNESSSLTSTLSFVEATSISQPHQLPMQCYAPTDSDDESFVVLGNGSRELSPTHDKLAPMIDSFVVDESLEMTAAALLRSLTPQPLPNMPLFDGITASVCSSVSIDELQLKIESLIEENQKLSDSLTQNNMVMKSQYETLTKWQEDVERVHESHKKKFAETKEYIQKLQAENKKLKDLCASLQMTVKNSEEAVNAAIQANVSVEDVSTSMDNVKQNENEINDLKQALKDAVDQLANKELEMHAMVANMNTLSTVSSLQSVELFNIKSELTNTKSNSNSFETEADDLRKEVQSAKMNEVELQNKIVILGMEKAKLEVAIDDLRKIVEDLRTQLEDEKQRKQQLEEETKKHECVTSALNEMYEKEEKWLKDVAALKCQIVKMKNSDTGEFQHLRIQLNAAQSFITELKESKKVVEQEAKLNRDAVDAMDKQIKDARVLEDKVVALNEQLRLYRANLDKERSAKFQAIEEVNKLSTDMQMVQKRNFELMDEVESFRLQQRDENAVAEEAAGITEEKFQCPQCSFGFYNYRALENHVYRCVDLNMLP